ncbi:MAG: hypothetical protein IJ088_03415 [Clostridia bacterium]|nr:hypothetical protein [Clostridia bacterium]
MNNYYAYLLRDLMERNQIVSVYSDSYHPDDFVVGRIEQMDSEHFLICEFTPWGEVDGYRIRRVQDVFSVLYGEEYEERIRLMRTLSEKRIRRILPQEENSEESLLLRVFRQCQVTKEIITLEIGMEGFSGRVLDCNSLYLTMGLLDYFGNPDGEETFEVRDIGIVQLRSGEEWMYRELEKWQNAERLKREETEGKSDENHDPDDVP